MALADALNDIVRLATLADHSVMNCAYGDKSHGIKVSEKFHAAGTKRASSNRDWCGKWYAKYLPRAH